MKKLLILVAAGALLVAYTAPAAAAEWEFFGNVMFRTFWEMDSDEANAYYGSGIKEADDDLLWGRECDVAVGATIKAGDIGGFVMYRPVEAWTHTGDLAQFYGTWNFGAGVLTIGKAMGPANFFPSRQVWLDNQGLVGQGGMFTYFKPMIMGTFGNFKIALVEPETTIKVIPIGGCPPFSPSTSNPWYWDPTHASNIVPTAAECDTYIPKIEASYQFDAGPVTLWLGGGYQTFDEVTVDTGTEKDYSIDAYLLGLGWKIPLGAFWVNGVVMMGQNLGQYQCEWWLQNGNAAYDPTYKDEIIDNDAIGYNLVVGYKVSDTVDFEVGYGHSENELDVDEPGIVEDDLNSYYIQANIKIAAGFTLTPEVGMIDWGQDFEGTEQGDTTYFGARWQIVF